MFWRFRRYRSNQVQSTQTRSKTQVVEKDTTTTNKRMCFSLFWGFQNRHKWFDLNITSLLHNCIILSVLSYIFRSRKKWSWLFSILFCLLTLPFSSCLCTYNFICCLTHIFSFNFQYKFNWAKFMKTGVCEYIRNEMSQ